jgi:hypothetical protein
VLVSGLEFWGDPWLAGFQVVDDERTRTRLAREFDVPHLQLFSPPEEGDTFGPTLQRGIKVFQFPQWFVAQYERPDARGKRPLVHVTQLERNQWVDDEKRKRHRVVPVRFVRACVRGHLADIDWRAFAHRGKSECRRQLWWAERGASGDFVDIFVECDCGKVPARPLIEATKTINDDPVLGWCFGPTPWLGRSERDTECKTEDGKSLPFRLLVRNASNAYFGLVDRSITIPEPDQALRGAVGQVQGLLVMAEELSDLRKTRRNPQVQAAIGRFTDEQVWSELERRRDPGQEDLRGTKQAELETFLAVNGQEGVDEANSVFFAREQTLPVPRPSVLAPLDKVLRLERLREVSVQVGFTRFEAPSADLDGELDLDLAPAPLTKELRWLPAVENRGEGLFFSFDVDQLKLWAARDGVKKRAAQLTRGAEAWNAARNMKKSVERPVGYVLLHSLSHLLLNQLALDCGYAASSLRERVYFSEHGAGILLLTGSPDSEGTLGGLVNSISRPGQLEALFRAALESARLCSNDPVCASHRPNDAHDERFLQGAACHGCLLLPETSCEARNDFLDRALVVETVEMLGCALFEG